MIGLALTLSISLLAAVGTPSYQETEVRLAARVQNRNDRKKLLGKIMESLTRDPPSGFPSLLGRRTYSAGRRFETFVYRDIYLDTEKFDLVTRGLSYRLRYRFGSPGAFLGFRLFPSWSLVFPSRCEIQFKEGYHFDESSGLAQAFEHRFEFRDDSPPFSEKKDAPPAPWPESEYIVHASSGKFGPHEIEPFERLRRTFEGSLQKLSPSLEIRLVRHRTHFSVKNPWGGGPNPDQVILISVDESQFLPRRSRAKEARAEGKTNPEMVEVEIEIDRSTLAGIERGMKVAGGTFLKGIDSESVKEFSREARDSLLVDLKAIARNVRAILTELQMNEQRAMSSKYSLGAEQLGLVDALSRK